MEHKETFLGRDEKAFTEGSQGNGFKSDQESHNNQNLLNDVFHSSWIESTKNSIWRGKKGFSKKSKPSKAFATDDRFGLNLGICRGTFFKIKYD